MHLSGLERTTRNRGSSSAAMKISMVLPPSRNTKTSVSSSELKSPKAAGMPSVRWPKTRFVMSLDWETPARHRRVQKVRSFVAIVTENGRDTWIVVYMMCSDAKMSYYRVLLNNDRVNIYYDITH